MGSLFIPEPEQWGLRGDAYLWRALSEELHERSIPATDEGVENLLVERIRDLAAFDVRQERRIAVHRDQFAHGGMSSGQIHVPAWRDRLVPLLIVRAAGSRRA
jgi:hypothetical protein